MKKNVVFLTLLILFILSASFGDTFAAQKPAKQKKPIVKKQSAKVIDLQSTEQLKEAFQNESGKIRLVTILSPT